MKQIVQIAMGLVSAVFIICAASIVVLNAGFLYRWDMENYQLEMQTGLSREEIWDNYQAMVKYNNLGGPDKLEFPTFSMSEGGRIHFEEVRRVFYRIEVTAIVTGILTVLFVLLSRKKKWLAYRFWTGILTLALPAVVGCVALTAWDWLFVTFHQLVFHNNYWIFDPELDPVITILPEGYFLHCLVLILILAFCAAAGFLVWFSAGRRALSGHRAGSGS